MIEIIVLILLLFFILKKYEEIKAKIESMKVTFLSQNKNTFYTMKNNKTVKKITSLIFQKYKN